MKISKIFIVGLAGCASLVLLYPIVVIAVYADVTLEGCRNEAYAFGCGLFGIALAPVAYLLITALALKKLRVRHWLAVTLGSTAALIELYLLCSNYSSTLTTPGVIVWVVLTVAAGLIFAATYAALPDRVPPLHKGGLRQAKWFLVYCGVLVLCVAVPWAGNKVNANRDRQDTATSSELNDLSDAMDEYDLSNHVLAPSLAQLDVAQTYHVDYHITGSNTYQLCATFQYAANNGHTQIDNDYPDTLTHPSGYHCFSYKDPRLTPPAN